nr:MAG TPA: hypothetical protein [Caudoviricetes sp.]
MVKITSLPSGRHQLPNQSGLNARFQCRCWVVMLSILVLLYGRLDGNAQCGQYRINIKIVVKINFAVQGHDLVTLVVGFTVSCAANGQLVFRRKGVVLMAPKAGHSAASLKYSPHSRFSASRAARVAGMLREPSAASSSTKSAVIASLTAARFSDRMQLELFAMLCFFAVPVLQHRGGVFVCCILGSPFSLAARRGRVDRPFCVPVAPWHRDAA